MSLSHLSLVESLMALDQLITRDLNPSSAEEIVWAASRPDHVNIADVLVFPTGQCSSPWSKSRYKRDVLISDLVNA